MVGCGDDTGVFPPKDASADGATGIIDTSVSEASGAGAGAIDGGVLHGIVAVQSTDYKTTAISLLDRDGNVLNDGCFDSGTKSAGLTLTLSGDVVLPTQMPAGSVVLVDRENSVVTWLDSSTCAPLRQLSVSTGFDSNPHDYVEVGAGKAYVPRYKANPVPTADPNDFDEGNDLVVINTVANKIVGRIDLLPYAPVGVLPRSDRALAADGKVFVSLNAVDDQFNTYGAGRVVVIDPSVDRVSGFIDLPTVKNCGAMDYVAADKRLFIACTGDYNAADQAATSAVVIVDLSATPPAVVTQIPASAAGGFPFSNTTIAALDGATAVSVTEGDFAGTTTDRLWLLATTSTSPTKIFEASKGFVLGAVLVDAGRGRAFVADGNKQNPLLRIFDRDSTGAFKPAATVQTNPKGQRPPRALAWF
jgi:hypothetical protein